MTTSGALDLGISLFFVYLLLSLLCTAACELISSLLAMRRKLLFKAIGTLLGAPALRDALFAHPLLKGISHGPTPSYVPRELFAAAALDVLTGADRKLTGDLERAVLALTRGTPAEGKLEKGFAALGEDAAHVRQVLGQWFEDSMSRLSGAYKRSSQRVVLVVAVVLVSAFNVDTVAIARSLWLRPELRTAIAQQAATYVTTAPQAAAPSDDPQQNFDAASARLIDTTKNLAGLGLPLGWPDPLLELTLLGVLGKLAGLLVTVLACSLGAPFWFDLLGKLVNVRGAGRKPS